MDLPLGSVTFGPSNPFTSLGKPAVDDVFKVQRTKTASNKLTLDVKNIPELVWDVRREMAKLLREEADAEALPMVAERLRELAARFEAGA